MLNVPHAFFRTLTSKETSWIWMGLLLLLLAACSTPPAPDVTQGHEFAYVATARIEPGASQAEVEARYGGSAVVFRPEAGFAVLGFDADEARLTTLSVSENQDAFQAPEAQAAGYSVWGGGWTAWSGGYSVWGGGWTAWSGGWTAWSGGSETPTTFGENLVAWDQINLPEAQQLAPNLGSGVKVAVLDTGIDLTHPAFAGRLAPPSEWKDFVDGDGTPMDEPGGNGYGHGTGVAGVVLQVAPDVTILPLRVLDRDGGGSVTSIAAAMDWAVEQGADVINLSLGTNSYIDEPIRASIEYAGSLGVVVVSSSGNTGDQKVTYPASKSRCSGACGDYAVSVGSVGAGDVLSPFSTYASKLEVFAPGESVTTLAPEAGVTRWNGTSFAAPMVSGTIALALAEPILPELASEVALFRKVSDRNIYDVNPDYGRYAFGYGRLDAERYLQKLLGL